MAKKECDKNTTFSSSQWQKEVGVWNAIYTYVYAEFYQLLENVICFEPAGFVHQVAIENILTKNKTYRVITDKNLTLRLTELHIYSVAQWLSDTYFF